MIVSDSQKLDGVTVSISATGILLQAPGSIKVSMDVNGQRCSGRLVRGFPVEPGTMAWAVQLDAPAETT